MIELQVVEIDHENRTKGLGAWVFLYPPHVGEILLLHGPAPTLDFYEVVSIEHVPMLPDGLRSISARPHPSVKVIVKWVYDED